MDEVAMDDEAGTCMALKKALVGLQATNAKHIEDGVNSLKKEGMTASSTKATDELTFKTMRTLVRNPKEPAETYALRAARWINNAMRTLPSS